MNKQVFQTDDKARWMKFKWTARVVVFFAIMLIAIFITMFIIDRIPSVPFRQDYRSAMTASRPFLQETKYSREYKGFRQFISERKQHNNYAQEKQNRLRRLRRFDSADSLQEKNIDSWTDFSAGIRAGFYVSWDPKSFTSLRRNIHNLNLVMPEWIFLNPKTDGLKVNIDNKGLVLMRKSGVPIMPILSNNINKSFRGDLVGRILHNPVKRRALINSIVYQCVKNDFVGINIDFEELTEDNDEYLISFIKDLSTVMHNNGLLVSEDVEPFNEDYNYKELAKYVDYLVLMAYDEYSQSSDAGPISSQKWIEAALDQTAKDVPNNKIILGLAAFGYDWSNSPDGNVSINYQDALSKAAESGSKIDFDNNTYNLSYAYQDERDYFHQVYFTDAATTFNVMRFGSEYGLAGFGLWRMGSEDKRIWKYYSKNMEEDPLGKMGQHEFEEVKINSGINYLGDGEILDVKKTPQEGEIKLVMDDKDRLIAEEDYVKIPTSYQIMKYGEADDKELLLTFDDGPDYRWTPKILDILKKYGVHAAFFLVGIQAERNVPIVKRIYEEGNLIGNHTFTHRNVANVSPDRTFAELKLTRLLIECITGHTTILFRPPYNADSEPANMEELVPVVLARQQNYIDVGESIDPEDWEPGISADEIFNRVIKQVKQGAGHVILLHDAGGDTRKETIKALPRIIEYFQKRGYKFVTLDKILSKNRDQLMPNVEKGKEYYAMQANLALVTATYDIIQFLTAMFLIFIILGFGRLIFMVVLTVKERRRERRLQLSECVPSDAPKVSIIVPAYNEEVDAVSSLENLMNQDYPNFNIIFVDDGSKDNTYQCVRDAFSDNEKMVILTKPNGGKASALNFGIAHTDAEYLVCIDADTKLLPNAVSLLMAHFLRPNAEHVGSVAGNVKVGNQRNMLTKWQAIEYTTSQNFDRMAYAAINAITVVPGAIGAFRKKAIEDAGGLTTDTLAEDCDLTIRINRAGYVIENENRAVALTEAPEHIKQFMKQRVRWSFGIMQTFWKHRDALMVRKYKGLGFWALPNMLVFQFIIPTFSPLADLFMIFGLFSGNAWQIFLYYLLFTAVDSSVSIAAYIFEKQPLRVLFWIIPQRFVYRWIMYVVLFRSYKRAIKGELQTWGVLKRTGNVGKV
jgi:cellulose synthase/poly-beta-1,6-N-acetylglucosamine synthase-like glycosyltransferase/spore germination protein YaaH/peptidoglycan/xylan/chitin deacetylase (PgdA/CDA1 family)